MDKHHLAEDLTKLTNECIHCGLCLESCPTYALTGAEPDSPRGRIHLMKALLDGALEPKAEVFGPLDRCVGCRACETACPSSVRYGHLLEAVRADYVAPNRPPKGSRALWKAMLDHLLPYAGRLRFLLAPLRAMQRLAPGLVKGSMPLLPGALSRQIEMLGYPTRQGAPIPEVTLAVGERRGRVAFLTGCVMDALYRPVNRATVRMLARSGYDVWVPRAQGCCGALHMHEGDRTRALQFMRQNLDAFKGKEWDAVILNSAGCGAAMKDYGHWVEASDPLHSEAQVFAAKVKDVSEFLQEVGIPTPTREIPLKAAYHEPCHLGHGQQVRTAPRALLRQIPGLQLVPLTESDWCCGGAGSYTLLQPDRSEQLLARKLNHVDASGADLVVTGNPSCLMQLGLGLNRRNEPPELVHTIELLDRAYADRPQMQSFG